uniref:RNA helicase n=1 Tax=Globodera pallida TaxID=36090 RepID=A0A183BI01_GLOPA
MNRCAVGNNFSHFSIARMIRRPPPSRHAFGGSSLPLPFYVPYDIAETGEAAETSNSSKNVQPQPKTQFVASPEESESDEGGNDAVFGGEQRKRDRKNTAEGAGRRGFLENVATIKKAREQSKSRERNKPKAEEDLLGRQGNPKILKPEKYMPPKRNEEVFADESQITVLTGGGTTQIELIRSFSECELPEPIKRNIELKRYLVPTPIQKAVIPLIKNTKSEWASGGVRNRIFTNAYA